MANKSKKVYGLMLVYQGVIVVQDQLEFLYNATVYIMNVACTCLTGKNSDHESINAKPCKL